MFFLICKNYREISKKCFVFFASKKEDVKESKEEKKELAYKII